MLGIVIGSAEIRDPRCSPEGSPGRQRRKQRPMHKFRLGQIVYLRPDRGDPYAPRGTYEITKQLPHDGLEFVYRIKSVHEEHERIARESQLRIA
jgi:hypothetical protein